MDDKSDATINIADSVLEADKGLLFYHGRLSLLMTSKAISKVLLVFAQTNLLIDYRTMTCNC